MYHFAEGDVSRGPVSKEALRGRIDRETLVWRDGMADWVPAGSLAELADLFAPAYDAPIYAEEASTGEQPWAAAPVHYQNPTPMLAVPPGTAGASMILGIVGIVFTGACGIGLICSILAVIFGYQARRAGAVGQEPGAAQATAGIIMGWIMIALSLVVLGLMFLGFLASL